MVNGGVQEVRIRSVLTCETTSGVCGMCYGRDLARGTPVNMGEAVGVIAAQSIGEPGTQLTMRTFHIGGAAQLSEQSFVESNFEGTVKIKNKNVMRNSDGADIVMSRNLVVTVVDPDGTERAMHRIPYGGRLRVADNAHIARGQRIAEWDPYTRPILTEVEGLIGFEDLIEGQSMSETLDETTGIAKRSVVDWRTGSGRGQDLRPALVIKGKDGKILKLARGGDARYILAVDAIVSFDPDSHVKRATSSPAFRPKAPRRATSPAVCRVLPSCSRRGGRRRRRSSPKFPARCASAATTRTSGASPSSLPRRMQSPGSISLRRASTSTCRTVT